MQRDSIFYKLFQQSPSLVFELLPQPPANAQSYRFDSVAVKEPRFEIDGVFLPPDGAEVGVVYFCEIQFQKDQQLYERVFAESALYFYRNRERFSDWQAVIIYPSRGIEQDELYPHRGLLSSEQVHRVYLDELGELHSLPLWVAAMVLTITNEAEAPAAARSLLARTEQEDLNARERGDIVDVVTSIMVYKLADLSRAEIRAMLGLNLTEEPRAIREAKQEGREEGREEGRREEAVHLLLRLLTKRFGNIPETTRMTMVALPLSALETLSEVLLDFASLDDLQRWLAGES